MNPLGGGGSSFKLFQCFGGGGSGFVCFALFCICFKGFLCLSKNNGFSVVEKSGQTVTQIKIN